MNVVINKKSEWNIMKNLTSLKWGMIGCGDVTEKKSGPAFNKVAHSSLAAVMCRTPGRARDYAQRHHIPRWYENIEGLLQNQDVNAIYVATPPDSHAYYTELVAATGRPVYVEKPMARTYKECLRMIDVCEKADVPLFVAYYRRRLPKFLQIEELLNSGTIGEVRAVSTMLLIPPGPADLNPDNLPWRVIPEIAGGGYFVDLASHQLDLLDYLLGSITEASGVSGRQAKLYPAEDIVSAHFRFESGIIGNGLWCFSVSEPQQIDRTEIIGSAGKITFSFFDASSIEVLTDTGLNKIETTWPEYVQQPLIETVVEELSGKGVCPSTGRSAARTSFVMDLMLNRDASLSKGQ
ncbi:MAG: Gfo/Idh/MocA family oxidoreductase [Calditrichia bacterium]